MLMNKKMDWTDIDERIKQFLAELRTFRNPQIDEVIEEFERRKLAECEEDALKPEEKDGSSSLRAQKIVHPCFDIFETNGCDADIDDCDLVSPGDCLDKPTTSWRDCKSGYRSNYCEAYFRNEEWPPTNEEMI